MVHCKHRQQVTQGNYSINFFPTKSQVSLVLLPFILFVLFHFATFTDSSPHSSTGVRRYPIRDPREAWELLERGRERRMVSAPSATHSHASSRSHALLTLDLTQPAAHTRSTLTLVDLAGR